MTIAPAASPAASSQLISSALRAAAGVTGMQLVYVSSIDTPDPVADESGTPPTAGAATSAPPGPTYTWRQLHGAFPGISVGHSVPLSDTFCARMLAGATPFTADAAADPAYADAPAREALGITSYAGIALRANGAVTGTLCGIDTTSVTLDTPQLQVMAALGRVISAETERDPQCALHRTATGWEVEQGTAP